MPLYHDTALDFMRIGLFAPLCAFAALFSAMLCQNFLVGHLFLMVTVVQPLHLVDNLTLFQEHRVLWPPVQNPSPGIHTCA